MLSAKSAEIVEATLPAVGGAIGEITPLFYDTLFADHPELLRDRFNRGNQANGTQRQALAGSIAATPTTPTSWSTSPTSTRSPRTSAATTTSARSP
ncbi:hypothetical protein ACFVXQ_34345, partial [Kitasatospora sp. NPDC058263]